MTIQRRSRGPIRGIVGLVIPVLLGAQPGPTRASTLDSSKTAFQDAKVGLFVHWGVYRVKGQISGVLRGNVLVRRATLPQT